MINDLSRNIIRFIILVLVQIFILDNLQISSYAVPLLYVMFILLLPFKTPGWLLLFSAFFMGFTMDIFEHTYGIHTAATVLMAWFRPGILQLLSPREGYETNTSPRIYYYGFRWFFRYTLILVFIHHLFLFYFEVFTFSHFFTTLLRVIISSLFTIFLVVLSQFFVHRKKGFVRE